MNAEGVAVKADADPAAKAKRAAVKSFILNCRGVVRSC